MTEKQKFPTYKDHLNKTFLEELNYKIWSTKGARFLASRRLLLRNDWSNKAIAFLSAYLIILGLLSVYQISLANEDVVNPNILAFGSTAISILVLLYSQLEASQDYKMRAHHFHDCSLKLAPLYNEARIFKTLKIASDVEKEAFALKLANQYQEVLSHYENHSDIDYLMFRASEAYYFHFDRCKVYRIKVSYYFQTLFIYHSIIALPILVMIILVMRNKL
ncbi:MAG: SLATT domain-containing protein [Bacteroidota bacterium]